jgi:hypothetical protein
MYACRVWGAEKGSGTLDGGWWGDIRSPCTGGLGGASVMFMVVWDGWMDG